MSLNWQYIALIGIAVGWSCFDRWLSRAYPKPSVKLKVGEQEFEAPDASEINRIIEATMWIRS